MARAVIVCSECGKQLTAADKFCSQCGAKVDADPSPVKENLAPVSCEVCGHENAHGGAFCEACGAKLSGRPSQASAHRGHKSKSPASSNFKFEPWHYIVGTLVVLVGGILIYSETTRNVAPSNAQLQTMPMQMPTQQPTAPSKEILDAITRLESTVKQNPNDDGATLLLANALHDAGTHDGMYFPRAIEAYKSYLKKKPNDPNARVDLGICYFELGKLDSTQSANFFALAINEMESTLKSNPTHQPGAFNLGIVYLYTGDVQQSNKWFSKAIELNPESDLGKRAKSILEQHSQAG